MAKHMAKKYTTISNTSIGGFNFVEAVLTNWNFDGQSYKVSELCPYPFDEDNL